MPEHHFDSPDPVRGPRVPQPPRDPKGGPSMPEHRFHTPDPVELRVTIPSGEISVETVDGDETVVTVEGTAKLVEQTTVEQRGGTIVVEFQGKHAGISIAIGNLSFGGGAPRGPRTRPALEPGASRTPPRPTWRSTAGSPRSRSRRSPAIFGRTARSKATRR